MSPIDAWRLALGTFTAIPTSPPRTITRRSAGLAMVLAPFATVPLGILVASIVWAGRELELSPWAVAAVAVGALALSTRAFHLDGLADTADGLSASCTRERTREVMKAGNSGPAGVAAIVIVVAVQIGALATLPSTPWAPAAIGIVVCVARWAACVGCLRAVPSASTGLGASFAGSVAPITLASVAVGAVAATSLAAVLLDLPWWRGVVAAAVAAVVVGWLVRRAVTRVGGTTGDTLGASIELALAASLLALT